MSKLTAILHVYVKCAIILYLAVWKSTLTSEAGGCTWQPAPVSKHFPVNQYSIIIFIFDRFVRYYQANIIVLHQPYAALEK